MTEKLRDAIFNQVADKLGNKEKARYVAGQVYGVYWTAVRQREIDRIRLKHRKISFDNARFFVEASGLASYIYDPESNLPLSDYGSHKLISPGLVKEWIDNPDLLSEYDQYKGIGRITAQYMMAAVRTLALEE